MKLKNILLPFCLFLLLINTISIKGFDVPEPSDNYYVLDSANVISEETEKMIIKLNAELENKNGSQLVVAAVDFLDGESIDDVAYEMFNKWEIGSSEYNNGVLLLLAIGEEDYYCLQGDGITDSISSGRLQMLLDYNLEPDFALAQYDQGISKMVESLYDVMIKLEGVPYITPPSNSGGHQTSNNHGFSFGGFLFEMFFAIIILVILASVVGSVFRPRRYYGGMGMPTYRRRPIIFHDHHDHHRPSSGGFGSFGGGSSFGGRSSGGGAGRSSFGGGRGSGGGGSSCGGGAGRR